MPTKYSWDDDDDQQRPRRSSAGSTPTKPQTKQSYESSADVQRWLHSNQDEADDSKPPFDPQLLAGRRDRDWLLSSLGQFYREDLITDVLQMVKSGKEATVYCCAADPALGPDVLAAKVYRPRMFRSLSNDALYRGSRTQFDLEGRVLRGGRTRGAPGKNERGRAAQVSAWIGFEWETQRRLHGAGADVPQVWSQLGNAVLMEYIGAVGEPAPLLREVRLEREEAEPLWSCILRNIELFLAHDRIHGDLSAYNILYWQGQVIIIDFAQAIDPCHSGDVFALLARDVERVYSYFAPYGVVADPEALAMDLWQRYERGQLKPVPLAHE